MIKSQERTGKSTRSPLSTSSAEHYHFAGDICARRLGRGERPVVGLPSCIRVRQNSRRHAHQSAPAAAPWCYGRCHKGTIRPFYPSDIEHRGMCCHYQRTPRSVETWIHKCSTRETFCYRNWCWSKTAQNLLHLGLSQLRICWTYQHLL